MTAMLCCKDIAMPVPRRRETGGQSKIKYPFASDHVTARLLTCLSQSDGRGSGVWMSRGEQERLRSSSCVRSTGMNLPSG